MDAGFEAIGVVAAVGKDVKHLKVGDAVLATSYGAFSEYQVHRAKQVLPMPSPDASFITLLVSGLTASIALEVTGELKQVGVNGQKQETVLVTAAAGGTGLFAVQLAKLLGHHVIGTCSSDDKVDVLKRLGCDRVINYKKENFGLVLKKEYPRGIDVVYESVGGDMFVECVRNLAVKGRLIVIGFVSGYADGSGWSSGKGDPAQAKRPPPPLAAMILGKSASIRGFFLNDFTELFKRHLHQLSTMIAAGQLQSIVDPQTFVGLEAVPDAIDYLYQGKNVGKIVIDLAPELHQHQAKKGSTLKSKL